MDKNMIGGGPKQPQINISENTTQIFNDSGDILFVEGVIFRKVSKFLTGESEDSLIPIPVYYDPDSLKILSHTVPPALRKELEQYLFDV